MKDTEETVIANTKPDDKEERFPETVSPAAAEEDRQSAKSGCCMIM